VVTVYPDPASLSKFTLVKELVTTVMKELPNSALVFPVDDPEGIVTLNVLYCVGNAG
jgi:hypothetical protein